MIPTRLYYLAAVTIFLSSFLLFQVQPLIGKHILRWFGGSAAVWLTAMLFFMVALGVGYGYALVVTRLTPVVQVLAHSGFLVSVGLVLWRHAAQWPSAITPAVTDVSLGSAPTVAILTTLTLSVGLPFVALSATSTLVQLWYGRLSGTEPFSLYSVSNIGSLLGLLSYPFLLERLLPTTVHGAWWSYGFGVYVVLLLILMGWYVRHRAVAVRTVSSATHTPVHWRRFLLWVGLTAVPVATLVSGTKFLTSAIAPVPLLWVVPLALYLVSFIVSFRPHQREPLQPIHGAMVFFGTLSITFLVTSSTILLLVPLVLLALFLVYHMCHEALYEARPDTEGSPLYYVALALGGIVGSGGMTLVALYLLVLPIEFLLILMVVVGYSMWQFVVVFASLPIRGVSPRTVAVAGIGLVVVLQGTYVYQVLESALVLERNFYGAKAIYERSLTASTTARVVVHGKTNHGAQLRVDDAWLHTPVAYYATSSGVGRALTVMQEAHPDGLRVVVMGLASGGLAAYCRPQDAFTFIEIDPTMVTFARDYFTWLEQCPQAEIIVADGRLALAEQAAALVPPTYDVMILDAYADDVMPIHLMTEEAFQLYHLLLADDGLIAINISSRYLELRPVLAALANDTGLVGRVHFDSGDLPPGVYASLWGVFAKDDTRFTAGPLTVLQSLDPHTPVRWTDTHSALFPIVKLW
jgi:spermidine synthase